MSGCSDVAVTEHGISNAVKLENARQQSSTVGGIA